MHLKNGLDFFSEKLSYFLAHIIKSKTNNKKIEKVALVESWSSQPGERDEIRVVNKIYCKKK